MGLVSTPLPGVTFYFTLAGGGGDVLQFTSPKLTPVQEGRMSAEEGEGRRERVKGVTVANNHVVVMS